MLSIDNDAARDAEMRADQFPLPYDCYSNAYQENPVIGILPYLNANVHYPGSDLTMVFVVTYILVKPKNLSKLRRFLFD